MPDIYETIWNSAGSHVSVSRRGADGQWIDPGTSALLVLVSDDVRPVVLRELSRFEGRVLYCTFPDAVRRELERALGTSGGDRADKAYPGVIIDEPAR